MSTTRLVRWLTRRSIEIDSERTKTILLKRASSDGASPIASKPFPPEEGFTCEDYATDFYNLAEDDAGGLEPGERHSYLLLAKSGKEVVSTCPFFVLLDAPEVPEAGIGSNGKATIENGYAASLRHAEAIFRTVVPAWTEILRSQERQAKQREDYIASLERSKLRTLELQEQLIANVHQREIAFAEERRKQELQDEGVELMRAYVPSLMTMVGKKYNLLPPATGKEADPRLAQVKELVATLTPDQFSALSSTLRPAQQLLLTEIYLALQQDVEKDIAKEEEKTSRASDKVKERMAGKVSPGNNGSAS